MLRRLLTANTQGSSSTHVATLLAALRTALGLCFIGYGMAGVFTTVDWIRTFAFFGIPEWLAWPSMPVLGALSASLGIIVLIHPCEALVAPMAAWALLQALVQPWAGSGIFAALARSGDIGPGFVLWLVARGQSHTSFDRIEAIDGTRRVQRAAEWVLRLTIILCLVGHAGELLHSGNDDGLRGFLRGDIGPHPYGPLKYPVVRDMWMVAEVVVACALIFTKRRPFLLTAAYLQAVQAALMPPAAGTPQVAHFLSEAGSYLAPLALAFVIPTAEPDGASRNVSASAPANQLHLIRIAIPAFAFCTALATAHAWMRTDSRELEHRFQDVQALVEAGYDRSGWMPRELPASSRHIREVHDLTTSIALGAFHVADPSEFESLRDKLRTMGGLESTCLPPAALLKGEPHWSSALLQQPQRLDLIAGTDRRSFAFDPDTGQVFFWSCD